MISDIPFSKDDLNDHAFVCGFWSGMINQVSHTSDFKYSDNLNDNATRVRVGFDAPEVG